MCESLPVRLSARHFAPAALALLATSLACGRAPEPAAPAVPGVVLLCIDTLRADVLSPTSTGGPALPALARLASEGVTFAEASAAASWTSPSVSTVLTGLLPRQAGVSIAFAETTPTRLAPGLATLASRLQQRGWSTTACTAGGWVTPENGLGRGFDRFTTNFDLHEPRVYVDMWNEDRPKDKPFFLFLHTFAAHDPYGDKRVPADPPCPPDPYVRDLGGRIAAALDDPAGLDDALYAEYFVHHTTSICEGRWLDRALGTQRTYRLAVRLPEWLRGGWRRAPAADQPARLRSAYESGLAQVDRHLADTLRALDEVGLPKETVIVVLGDHGEAFGEDGQLCHGQSLHDAVLRVPLVVRAPGRLPAGRVVEGGCSLCDVTPTILELAGVPPVADLDGRSLVPLALGTAGGHVATAESYMGSLAGNGPRGLASVRLPGAKWVLSYDHVTGAVVREEVFDLAADPGETKPLPGGEASRFGPEFCRAVSRVAADIAARFGRPAAPPECR